MRIMTSRSRLVLPVALILLSISAAAQQKPLTLDDIYDPVKRVNFSGTTSNVTWMDGAHYVWARPAAGGAGVDWMKVDAVSGTPQPLFDAARMEAAVAKLPGIAAAEARRLPHSRELSFNDAHSAVLMTIAGDLYVYT